MTDSNTSDMASHCLAVVVIGRNEGERLRACLQSVIACTAVQTVVYVDSGSTDGSAKLAHSLGCFVVDLNMDEPFTAARARNEGFARALLNAPNITHVQFVDGDCEMVPGWLNGALQFLANHPEVAVVCGRRRERFPVHSIYNRLCDIEWNTPVGRARSCGGDVMMRADALRLVGGYKASLIAGEEPELCVRLRAMGWKIWRLDLEMTLHDAAMLHFSQWWKRSKRAGYAFAEGAYVHGGLPERHCVREVRRAWGWGVIFPLVVMTVTTWQPMFAWLLLAYPLQWARLTVQSCSPGSMVGLRAMFLVLSKFPEGQGAIQFEWNKFHGKAGTLIEYK